MQTTDTTERLLVEEPIMQENGPPNDDRATDHVAAESSSQLKVRLLALFV